MRHICKLDLQDYINNICYLVSTEDKDTHIYRVYKPNKVITSEQQYLNIMIDLLKAETKKTRNAITRSMFSNTYDF